MPTTLGRFERVKRSAFKYLPLPPICPSLTLPARMENHLHRGQIRGAKIKNGTGGNAKLDRRHDRRALSHEEAEWLLRTTRQAKTRWKLSGIQRFWLYRLAMATGLR
ncbi:MAG: hypothetical protein WCO91_11340, partial [Gemmataceae bacterium]